MKLKAKPKKPKRKYHEVSADLYDSRYLGTALDNLRREVDRINEGYPIDFKKVEVKGWDYLELTYSVPQSDLDYKRALDKYKGKAKEWDKWYKENKKEVDEELERREKAKKDKEEKEKKEKKERLEKEAKRIQQQLESL